MLFLIKFIIKTLIMPQFGVLDPGVMNLFPYNRVRVFLLSAAVFFPFLGMAEGEEIPVIDTGISDTSRGTISANTGSATIWKYGDNITIKTTGTMSHNGGLYSNLAGGLLVGNNLTIETSGEAADGIRTNPSGEENWMGATGKLEVGDGLKITTSGVSADAINLNGRASLLIGDNCEITLESTTSGGRFGLERAYAVRASHQAQIEIGKNLRVLTKNTGGYAIFGSKSTDTTGTTIDEAHPDGAVVIVGDGAQLETLGNSARAINMTESRATFLGGVSVETSGTYAYGAYVGSQGQIEFQGVAKLTTTGNYSHGVYMSGNSGSVKFFTPGSTITTSGSAAHGVKLDGGKVWTFDGTAGYYLPEIVVKGQNAAGLLTTGAGTLITVGGNEALTMAVTGGANTWGAIAENGGTIAFADNASTGGVALQAKGSSTRIGTLSFAGNASGAGSHVELGNFGQLDVSGVNSSATIGSLGASSASAAVQLGDKILIVGQDNQAGNGSLQTETSFAGAISGTGALEKVGEGKLSLTGNSTFGALHVREGTLAVTSTGTVALGGDVAVAGGAKLYVGGNLESATLTLNAIATVVLESVSARIHTQKLDLSGLAAEQKVGIEILDLGNLLVGESREVFSFDSVAGYYGTDLDANNYFSLVGGEENYVFRWSADGQSLLVTAVPEPTTYAALGGAGLLALVIGRRLRRK